MANQVDRVFYITCSKCGRDEWAFADGAPGVFYETTDHPIDGRRFRFGIRPDGLICGYCATHMEDACKYNIPGYSFVHYGAGVVNRG